MKKIVICFNIVLTLKVEIQFINLFGSGLVRISILLAVQENVVARKSHLTELRSSEFSF